MKAFEFVVILLSFVYALALTHLLSRGGILLTVRKRVRFSGLLALAMLNCILVVYVNWLSVWDLRTVRSWDIFTITMQFGLAVLLFALCSLVSPEVIGEGRIDLDDFYFEQRPLYYGTWVATVIVAMIGNTAFLKTNDPALFIKWNSAVLPLVPPSLLALVVKARWAQWLGGLALLVVSVWLTVTFEGMLG
jgi:hypothetical protein